MFLQDSNSRLLNYLLVWEGVCNGLCMDCPAQIHFNTECSPPKPFTEDRFMHVSSCLFSYCRLFLVSCVHEYDLNSLSVLHSTVHWDNIHVQSIPLIPQRQPPIFNFFFFFPKQLESSYDQEEVKSY